MNTVGILALYFQVMKFVKFIYLMILPCMIPSVAKPASDDSNIDNFYDFNLLKAPLHALKIR